MSEEQPLISLVTLKETGEIIDAQRCDYSFQVDEVMQRHDMSKVEITYKRARVTAPADDPLDNLSPPNDDPPARPATLEDDDVPF